MLPSDMLFDRFTANIRETNLFKTHQQILLAVSGGMDSMVMLDLFHRSLTSFGIAHCNFRLRGEEADKDQQMVERIAKQLGVRFYSTSFDTTGYARKHKLSIQMAARELRYEWLEQTRVDQGFDLIATAHHLDDSIETLLLNLCRGTGINGLTGIPARSKQVIRPLLFANRKDIEAYVENKGVEYREDMSNAEEKYLRNKIRHQIIPVMQEVNPSFRPTLKMFFSNMQATADLYLDAIRRAKIKCVTYENDSLRINISRLLGTQHPEVIIFEVIKEYGFSPAICKDIANNLRRQPGKTFFSDSHTLLTDRTELLVYPTIQDKPDTSLRIYESTRTIKFYNNILHFEHIDQSSSSPHPWQDNETVTLLDYTKLLFPLTIRPWKKGDRMTPLGMSGSKKISDLFIEEKIPLNKKKTIPVIVSDNDIVWVAGIRSSELFKITSTTSRMLRITCVSETEKTD
jgi:tRNA(Ile)-lysidine synthase